MHGIYWRAMEIEISQGKGVNGEAAAVETILLEHISSKDKLLHQRGRAARETRSWVVCLRSSNKNKFVSFMAQVSEKDHHIIKPCDTLTHDPDFSEGSSQGLCVSLYQGFLSSLRFGCLGQTRLERLQVSSFKESCGKPCHRSLCSAQELRLIRGSYPHCLSVFLCCRRTCPHLTARLATTLRMLLCCWDWWQCYPEGHEKGA